jgi:hypothetical protein
MRLIRRLAPLSLSLTLAVAAAVVTLSAVPAYAKPGYTYWGYYHSENGAWVASEQGANTYRPDDGAVEGLRWATTQAMPDRPPRADLTFEEICRGTEAAEGQKRIAFVIDPGTAEDAPEGDTPTQAEALCAAAPADATTQRALDGVADLRVENSLICGINGFPTTACSVEVAEVAETSDDESVEVALPAAASGEQATQGEQSGENEANESDDTAPWALLGVGVLLVALIGAGGVLARRRNRV